jgi:hypothetical protein
MTAADFACQDQGTCAYAVCHDANGVVAQAITMRTPGLVMLATLLAACANSPSRTGSGGPASAAPPPTPAGQTKTPREECEALMNLLLPLAQKMLTEHRAFLPYGAGVGPAGEMTMMMAKTGDGPGDANELIAMLELGQRQGAAEGKFKVTALVIDMVVIPPGKTAKQDGIAVRLDHRDGLSMIVGFPYSFSPTGELLIDPPFASDGAKRIFPRP